MTRLPLYRPVALALLMLAAAVMATPAARAYTPTSPCVSTQSTLLRLFQNGAALIAQKITLTPKQGQCELTGIPSQDIVPQTLQLLWPQGTTKHPIIRQTLYPTQYTDKAFYIDWIGKPVLVPNLLGTSVQEGILLRLQGDDAVIRTPEGFRVVELEDVAFPGGPDAGPTAEKPSQDPEDPGYRLVWQWAEPTTGATPAVLAYQANGLSWQAVYEATLAPDEATVLWAPSIVLSNTSRLTYPDADLRVVAGEPQRLNTYHYAPAPKVMSARAGIAESAADNMAMPSRQADGDYHEYALGRITLKPQSTQKIPLLAPTTLPVNKLYVADVYQQQGDDEDLGNRLPVDTRWEIATDTLANHPVLKNEPLPAGVVRLYRWNAAGDLSLAGETSLGNTAAKQPIRLTAGRAFDLTVRRRVLASQNLNRLTTQDIELTLSNQKAQPVTLAVDEHGYGKWKLVSEDGTDLKAKRLSADTQRLLIPVPAKGNVTLRYRHHQPH